jgi:hypothetical protein
MYLQDQPHQLGVVFSREGSSIYIKASYSVTELFTTLWKARTVINLSGTASYFHELRIKLAPEHKLHFNRNLQQSIYVHTQIQQSDS